MPVHSTYRISFLETFRKMNPRKTQALSKRGYYPLRNPKYRPPKERPALDFQLIQWLKLEHETDPLRSVRPPHFILSQMQRFNLTRVNANQIKSPSDITALLNESSDWEDEWALKLFNLFLLYKADLAILNGQKGKKQKRN